MLLVFGAISAAAMCFVLKRWAPVRQKDILTLLLVYIAAIYVGPVIGGEHSTGYLEIGFALALTIVCLFALRGGLLVLAAGYFAHAAWDGLHGFVLPHVLPPWYAPLCIGFDLCVALYLLIKYRSDMAASV